MLRRLYDWTLTKSSHPHAVWWLFAVAFLESSIFPIPPHPLLGLMCLAEPKKALRYAWVCTIASVLGGLVGYAIGYLLFESVGTAMLDALGLAQSFPAAACMLRTYGAEIIILKGATPIPFKLITITAGFIQLDLATFVWASLLSRALLFFGVGVLFRVFGAPIKAFIDRYLGWVTAGFIILIVAGFALAGLLEGPGGGQDGACEAPAARSAPAMTPTAPTPTLPAR